MEYYDGIYKALRNNKQLPVSAEEGLNVIKIIESALKSHKERKVIYL